MMSQRFRFKYEEFIYVGRSEQLEEIAAVFAALNLKERGSVDARQMKFFSYVEIQQAISYAESNHSYEKLMFMDDIFIQGNKIKNLVSQFINQAKNSKTTCVLTIHEPFGGEPEKSVRNAANWYGMFNLNSNNLSRLTGGALTPDSPFMNEYLMRSKFEKILFYNTIEHSVFNYDFRTINSVKLEETRKTSQEQKRQDDDSADDDSKKHDE